MPDKYPFDKVIFANIGNPQQVGQIPITFFRQVLSLLEWDHLLEEGAREDVLRLFPADAVARALQYRAAKCRLGAYTDSKGFLNVRQEVAEFISRRDGTQADPEHVYLTAGASEGITTLLGMLVHTEADSQKAAHQKVGIMIPTPQYPLYSATIALCGGEEVPYFLVRFYSSSPSNTIQPHPFNPPFSFPLSPRRKHVFVSTECDS